MKRALIYIILLILYISCSVSSMKAQTVFINEISICNISKELDPNYDYRGWIELYNATQAEIDLSKLFYSDELGKPTKYKLLNSRILPAGGYASIWINDEITDNNGLYLDTDPDGGFLSIADENGIILESINYPIQYTNVSWGRIQDGENEFGYFSKSSHNRSNNTSSTAFFVVAEPTFSLKGGFYSAPVSVSIDCKTEDAKIFYTLDGSDPTPQKNLYTGSPIHIDSSMPLRAKAFAEGYLEGTIATATYMINERVPELPVFFLTTDTINLYNDTIGIYCVGTNGIKVPGSSIIANYAQKWTRPAHLEFLDKNKSNCLDQAIGLSINGRASRALDQKSFQINSGKKYGKNRFDYQLFPNKEGHKYNSFVLRNGGQNNNLGAFQDCLLQSQSSLLNIDYQSSQTVVVYMNGKYWGILNLQERNDKEYIYSNYGWSEEQIDIIGNLVIPVLKNGNLSTFKTMNNYILNQNLSNDSIFETAKSLVDMDGFNKYSALEFYVGNTDWPNNNQTRFCLKSEGKFRWIIHDLDLGFRNDTINRLRDILLGTNSNCSFFKRLFNNSNFRDKYIDMACLVAGSIFNISRFDKQLDSISALLNTEWQYNSKRWGFSVNALSDNINKFKRRNRIYHTNAYVNLCKHFNLGEPLNLIIKSNEKSAQIKFNSLVIPSFPYDGMYFYDRQLILEAPEYVKGKRFQHWIILKNDIYSEKKELSLILSLKDSLTSVTAVYDLSDSVRRGGLYINEISASNAIFVDNHYKYEDWIEIYNASDTSINLAGYFLSNDSKYLELFQFKNTDSVATNIAAGGYSITWCSKDSKRGVMHSMFKLAKEGGSIFLSKKNKFGFVEIIDSLTYLPHSDYSSFGRYPDGDAGMYIFEKPTFRSTNCSTSYNRHIFNQKYDLINGLEGLTPPVVSNLLINDGEQKTADSIISINFQTSKSAVYYRISESPDFLNATWEPIEADIKFHLSPGFGKKTIYLQLKNALYLSNVISDDIEFFKKHFKIVVGFSGSSTKNVTEVVNEEVLNNTALSFKDSYTSLKLYDVWGNQTMRLAKKVSEISTAMKKYCISEGVSKTSTAKNPSFIEDIGVYPNKYYARAYFFSADSALSNESRRLIAGFINVPNGTYDIRILASQKNETPVSDYLSYRYQINNSDIYIPSSDIFFNNQTNFIEFKNITVNDSVMLICSWREPFGVKSGYYAPMNLIEISEAGTIAVNQLISERQQFSIYSGKGKISVESEELKPFTIYGIDGTILKQVVPESENTEIYLSPGVYIIKDKKAIVF